MEPQTGDDVGDYERLRHAGNPLLDTMSTLMRKAHLDSACDQLVDNLVCDAVSSALSQTRYCDFITTYNATS